jgi:hypothetical protein
MRVGFRGHHSRLNGLVEVHEICLGIAMKELRGDVENPMTLSCGWLQPNKKPGGD